MKKLSLIAATVLLTACQHQTSAPKATLNGEVFYLQRIALPPTAVLSVSLQDISLADAPAKVIDEQRAPVNGQVPLPFKLSYDPLQIEPNHRYSINARIEVDGKLLFITTENHAVRLDGSDPQPLKVRVDATR
jgi:putative lipoprotein